MTKMNIIDHLFLCSNSHIVFSPQKLVRIIPFFLYFTLSIMALDVGITKAGCMYINRVKNDRNIFEISILLSCEQRKLCVKVCQKIIANYKFSPPCSGFPQ